MTVEPPTWGHIKPSCPDPSQISFTVKTQSSPSRWLAPGCCLLLAGIPHCHLFITSLSQSDSQYPVDRWASSKAALAISVFHNPPPQSTTNISGLLREREIAAARSCCHFLPCFCRGDLEMSDRGRQLEHKKALALTIIVTFKALTKCGTEKNWKQFYSQIFCGEQLTPNKPDEISTFDSCKKQI